MVHHPQLADIVNHNERMHISKQLSYGRAWIHAVVHDFDDRAKGKLLNADMACDEGVYDSVSILGVSDLSAEDVFFSQTEKDGTDLALVSDVDGCDRDVAVVQPVHSQCTYIEVIPLKHKFRPWRHLR